MDILYSRFWEMSMFEIMDSTKLISKPISRIDITTKADIIVRQLNNTLSRVVEGTAL
jgi:hypothetical protein